MSTIPANHLTEAQKLSADGYVHLFQIDMANGSSLYLKEDRTETFNGNLWEGVSLHLSGAGSYADDQVARPKLKLQNPDAVFSPAVSQGQLNKAFITRYRVLTEDFHANRLIYISQVWLVGRVTSLNRSYVELELRSKNDAPNFMIPARTYTPPKFPVVSIR